MTLNFLDKHNVSHLVKRNVKDSEVSRLIEEDLKERIQESLELSSEMIGEVRSIVDVFKANYKHNLDEEAEELALKFIKKTVNEHTYLVLANAFELFDGNSGVLVASKNTNYHSFYKVGTKLIQDAYHENDAERMRKLIFQTSISNINDVKGDEIRMFLKIDDDQKLISALDEFKTRSLYDKLIKPFLEKRNNEMEFTWENSDDDDFNRNLRERLHELYRTDDEK